VSSSGSSPVVAATWLISASLVSATARRVDGRRRVQGADNQNAYVKRILINEFNRHWRRYGRLPVRADTDRLEAAVPTSLTRSSTAPICCAPC
jgi:DNA-directed RNA polymerase specialized sigma24 family protein